MKSALMQSFSISPAGNSLPSRRKADRASSPRILSHARSCYNPADEKMATKKKSKWKVSTEARRRARLGMGQPPAERTIPNKRDKPPKHKKPASVISDE